MRIFIFIAIMLLAGKALAARDCRIIEYPDHYEAVCVGDAKPVTGPTESARAVQMAAPAQIIPVQTIAPGETHVSSAGEVTASDVQPGTLRTSSSATTTARRTHRPQQADMDALKAMRASLITGQSAE